MTTQHKIPKGVQLIGRISFEKNPLYQKFLIIQDRDDRGTKTGICKWGLIGGGLELGETKKEAIFRERYEEGGINEGRIRQYGCYRKTRPTGYVNKNYVYYSSIGCSIQELRPVDIKEVSRIDVFSLGEIINLVTIGSFHEGSIRILFHFMNRTRYGSLDYPVTFMRHTF